MSSLKLIFFGQPKYSQHDRIVPLKSRKGLALLAYLAVENRRVSRDVLAGILWPDFDQVRARANLRRQLYTLNQTAMEKWLAIDDDYVALDPPRGAEIDLQRFERSTATGQMEALQEAVELYKADFLEGFHLPDSVPFEEWATLQREKYRRQVLTALDELAEHYLNKADYAGAESSARRQLELDDLRESAWRQLMRALTGAGRRAEALAAYQSCHELLQRELEVTPSAETATLAEELRQGEPIQAASERSAKPLFIGSENGDGDLDLDPSASPYRGLFAFREQDAHYFFGREEFTDRLVTAVDQQPIVAVVGPSGSGKSSVVNAGLLPQVRPNPGWQVTAFRPEARPFYSLAECLVPLLEPDLSQTEELVEVRKLANALGEGQVQLYDVVQRLAGRSNGRLLLLADQFEEVFTLTPDQAARHRFLDVLLDPVFRQLYQADLVFNLVLTMRADFVAQALSYRPLADALQEADVKLGPMSRAELTRSILNPASLHHVEFETGLPSRLLDDVGEEPGNLPLLEFALESLWHEKSNGQMTHHDYESIGLVQGALAQYADEVLAKLDEDARQQTRHVFTQLIRPGEGTEDTRRLALQSEIGKEHWSLVQQLADARLVVTGRDALGRKTVEIVHEALIQHWARMQAWLAEDRAFRLWQERLRVAARVWQEADQDQGSLLRGAALATAESWLQERPLNISRQEMGFIEASLKWRQARRRKEEKRRLERERLRRRVTHVLWVGLTAALILAAVAGWQWLTARDNFVEAERGRLAVEALNLIQSGESGEVPTLLALHSLDLGYSPEAQAALYGGLENGFAGLRLEPANDGVSMDFSPDGELLLTGSMGQGLILWEVETGRELRRLTEHEGIAFGSFSPDGELIATSGADGTIRLWDPDSGQELQVWEAHQALVNEVIFSPDGSQILSVSDDMTAKLWQVDTGEHVRTYELAPLEDRTNFEGGEENWMLTADFNEAGDRLVTGSADLMMRIWDVESGEVLQSFQHLSGIQIQNASFSPDETLILSVPVNDTAILWEVESGDPVRTLAISPDEAIIWAELSPDGQYVVTGGTDNLVRLWRVSTGELVRSYTGHGGNIKRVGFSPDGQTIISTGEDGQLLMWPLQLESEPRSFQVDSNRTYDVAVMPDGESLLVGAESTNVHLIDYSSGEITHQFPGHVDGVPSLNLSDDGSLLAAADWDGVIHLWDMESKVELVQLALPKEDQSEVWVFDVEFSHDLELLAAGDSFGQVIIWDWRQAKPKLILQGGSAEIWDLQFSENDGQLMAASWDGSVRVWDLPAGEEMLNLEDHEGPVNGALFLPGGQKILTTSEDQRARIWDRASGELLRQFPIAAGRFSELILSPDGESFYLGGGDNNVHRYELATGEETGRFSGHEEFIFDLTLIPDGQHLVTSGWDGAIKIWQTDTSALIQTVCQRIPRDLTEQERMAYDIHSEVNLCSSLP